MGEDERRSAERKGEEAVLRGAAPVSGEGAVRRR
jgi:hypothetical protein